MSKAYLRKSLRGGYENVLIVAGEILSDPAKKFEVIVDERVEKDLSSVPKHIVKAFLRALDELEKNPFRARPKMDIKKLVGHEGTYRLRIGDYRVLYYVDSIELKVFVTAIKHRKKVY
ncbi:MAG: type II toxin-antitoxin system RelE/ParE family toxin [Candidatus Thermoplasmatota archaeon]